MELTAELVLVLARPRGRFANVVSGLRALWGGDLPAIRSVDAYYDGARDCVIVILHYPEVLLTEGVYKRIAVVARDAGVELLDASRLDDTDRRQIQGAEAELRVENQPAIAIALWNLSRMLGGEDVWSGDPLPPPPLKARTVTPQELAKRASQYSMRPPRGSTPPTNRARATKPPPPPIPERRPTPVRGSAAPTPTSTSPPARVSSGVLPRTLSGSRPPMRELAPRAGTRPPVLTGAAVEDGADPPAMSPSPNEPDGAAAVATAEHARRRPDRSTRPRFGPTATAAAHVPPPPPRAAEGTAPPLAAGTRPLQNQARAAIGARPSSPHLRERTIDDRAGERGGEARSGPITIADPIDGGEHAPSELADPHLPPMVSEPSTIDVRYLRSGRWAPARLRALSLKGAYLITAAFPRVGDHVHIALGLGDLGALVRGVVFHVTTAADIATTGTSGFAVRFDLDEAARNQLATLLHRARARGVTITPPPPRGSVRLPVLWPVKLGTKRGAVKGDALDVSRGGMFVHPTRALEMDAPVSFSAVLDDGTAPISGRARVVRQISETDAARRGLRSGFGLSIQEMGDADLERWNLFIARVQKRSEHRILVGASPGRLPELTAGLSGAGYAVVGGTDPGTLVQLSDAEARPPDVAVIDATLFDNGEPNWLETLFSARKVPCVTLRGDARRARVVVDRLLSV